MKPIGFRLSFLSFAGLLAGVWIAISPWVLGYPGSGSGSWSTSELSDAAVGAAVIAASAVCLVASVTSSVHQLTRLQTQLEEQRHQGRGISEDGGR